MKKYLLDAISSPNFKASKLKRRMLLAALAAGSFYAMPAMAQLNYKATGATNTTTTYTDLGATGTAITVANNDDANSAAQPIGFTFNYNGQAFTQFVLNTNGFIKLGSTAPSAATLLNAIGSNLPADINMIAASSYIDLQGAANQTTNPTGFSVATTGTAPNRVTTIQFKNLTDKPTATFSTTPQFSSLEFQIKLYEGSNNIELVYGTWVASATTAAIQPMIVGLKGSSNAIVNRLFAVKAQTAAWSAATFATDNAGSPSLLPHLVQNSVLPTAGRTYRFTPFVIPANDLTVDDVFTQGKISVASGTPHQVKAVIRNAGSTAATNKTITLSVTGSNTVTSTATIASLAPGASTEVTFPAYTPTTVGENTIEVTVPNDDDNNNNLKEALQIVSANAESFAEYPDANSDPDLETATPAPYGNTEATNAGVRMSRFFATNRVRINSIRTYIPHSLGFTNPLNTVGRTINAVVVDAAGNILAQSADIVLTANDVDDFIDIPFTTTRAVVENSAYFVGIQLKVLPTATTYAYAFAAQTQAVNRTGAMYVMPTPGATPTAPVSNPSPLLLLVEAQLTNITGVKEDINANMISVYPNPSKGVFNVNANALKGSNLNLEVRDLQGKLVYSAAASKDGASIDLKNVASGIYMLRVSTDSEVAVKRLVVE